jgi:hypothetical protein
MARIRTVKPEMFVSESLAACSVTAERTFVGLLTLSDDKGRFRDHPAIIAGRLWPLRPEHTPLDVEDDLAQLAQAGLICRYTGCDGRSYLHIVTWDRHQKIDRPSAPRTPRCPHHQAAQMCGGCGADHCPRRLPSPAPTPTPTSTPPDVQHPPVEGSTNPRRAPEQEVSTGLPAQDGQGTPDAAATRPNETPTDTPLAAPAGVTEEEAGQRLLVKPSPKARQGLDEGSTSGPRILDPGSVPRGRTAPAPGTVSGSVSAKQLLAEYVTGCSHRPPNGTLGHLGKEIRALLDEGFDPEPVRSALERMRAKGLHPSVLPSVVNEVLNASPPAAASGAGPWASGRPAYTPWMNPTDTSVYEEAL